MDCEKIRVSYTGPRELVATEELAKPATITVRAPFSMPAGTELLLVLSNLRAFTESEVEILDVETEGDGSVTLLDENRRREEFPDFASFWEWKNDVALTDHDYRIAYVEVTHDIAAGERTTFTFETASTNFAGLDQTFQVWVAGPDESEPSPAGLTANVPTVAGPPARLELRPATSPRQDGQYDLTVFAADSLLNPADGYVGTVHLDADGTVEGLPEQVYIGPEDRGQVRLEGLRVDADAPVRIHAEDQKQRHRATSHPIPPRTTGGDNHYFGAIHFHSLHSSDGGRTVEDSYRYARDYLNLDVCAVTDHTPTSAGWSHTVATNERFHDPGAFVTVPSWEWSDERGHANIYLRDNGVEATPADYTEGQAESHPGDESWPEGSFIVPHHTNFDGQPYWTEYDWSRPNEDARLVEVVQNRGNFEANERDVDWGIMTAGNDASVQDALEMGYRLGFVGGTDNHMGYPTRAPSTREHPLFDIGNYCGLTGFLAPELTRDAIWKAMYDRRTYATTGVPIVGDFSVGDTVMGGETTAVDGALTFDATLHGTTTIERVEVISDGDVVWRRDTDATDLSFTGEEVPGATGGSSYYYLRLRQTDSHMAWLSPIWVDEA